MPSLPSFAGRSGCSCEPIRDKELINSVIPTLPGLVRNIAGPSSVGVGAAYIYCCVWPVGVTVAGLTYYIANKLFPYRWEPVEEVTMASNGSGYEEEAKGREVNGEKML